jgi:long-chain acyl-CoA synthetase
MGGSNNSKQHVYAKAMPGSQQPGYSSIYRNIELEGDLLTSPINGVTTMQQLWQLRFRDSANKQFLGQRPRNEDGTLEERFEWETYGEVGELVEALGSGFINLGLLEEKAQYRDYKLKFMAIYGKNSREWILVDSACCMYNIVTVPIYDTLGEDATEHMFVQTELSSICVSAQHIEGLCKMSLQFLKNLVILDEWNLTQEHVRMVQSAGFNLHRFTEVLAAGRKAKQPYPEIKPKDIALFSYTSGTTSKPKAAMISHRNILAALAGAHLSVPIIQPYVHLSYLPLAHVLERVLLITTLIREGQYGIFNGNVLNLKEDLAILRPTCFISVPRLFNKFHDKIKQKIDATTGCKGSIAANGVKTKLNNYEKGTYKHSFYDALVFKKIKQVLGGRVQFLLTGSAPISDDVKKFMSIAFVAPFSEGYGQTEGMGCEFVTHPDDYTLGIVGGPLHQNEFRLADVPEMNYTSNDKDENGTPTPRGEILVRGANVIQGYYKNPEKTAETFDSEGWLHSGDIGMVMPGSNALKIIDRRKNIFKLSQGEYVAPDKLEQVYKTAKGVADIFVYGDSLKSCLIGFVNVDKDIMPSIAQEIGLQPNITVEEFCQNPKAQSWILDELLRVNKAAKLKGFEKIKKVKLDPVEFIDNDLVTTTFKLKRFTAKSHYKAEIETMYEDLY